MSASEQSMTAIVATLLLTASQIQQESASSYYQPEQQERAKTGFGAPPRCYHWVIDHALLADASTALLVKNIIIRGLSYIAAGEKFAITLVRNEQPMDLFPQSTLATVDTLLRARHALQLLCAGATAEDCGFSVSNKRPNREGLLLSIQPSDFAGALSIHASANHSKVDLNVIYTIDSPFVITKQLRDLFDQADLWFMNQSPPNQDELSQMSGLLLRLCAAHWWCYYDRQAAPEASARSIAA